MGRTFSGGRGGQCGSKPVVGDMCVSHHRQHADGSGHGRVDGEIPAVKMAEFERALAGSVRGRGRPRVGGRSDDGRNLGGGDLLGAAHPAA